MISSYEAGFLFVFKARRRAYSWDLCNRSRNAEDGQKAQQDVDIICFQVLKLLFTHIHSTEAIPASDSLVKHLPYPAK